MSIQKQIKKELQAIERYELEHRTGIERLGAMVLATATLFSLTGLAHDSQHQRSSANRDVVIQQAKPIFDPTEKNETVRMPVRFDDGLRAVATTGQ